MTAQPDPAALRALVERLLALSEKATQTSWHIQDGCSWRRIGTHFHDGDVLCPTNSHTDGHPDLSAADGKLYANLELIVTAVNFVRDDLPRLLAAHDDERAADKARIGVLSEALEPFAKDADDWYTPGVHYDDSLELWQTGRTSVTVGHLRAARSALGGEGAESRKPAGDNELDDVAWR